MNSYSIIERYLSKFLSLSPRLHYLLKYFYQYINYIFHGKKFHISINQLSTIHALPDNANFFGYYDHTPWSDDMKYFLSHNQKNNRLLLELFDFKKINSISRKTLLHSENFNFQQGVKPIWINNREIIFNNVVSNKLSSSIYNIDDDTIVNHKYPIQEISNIDTIYFSIDYCKLELLNNDYGYNIIKSPIQSPKVDGIIGYNYKNKKTVFNLDINRIHSKSKNTISPNQCEINHLLSSPFDNKFIFIYRSKKNNSYSELFIYDYHKDSLDLLFYGHIVSHYCWIDKDNIFIYLAKGISDQGFYLLNYNNKEVTPLNKKISINGDGHPSISPDREWVIYDSYPDRKRLIHLNLYNLKTDKIIQIGEFFSPMKFHSYYRCDLHPRWSPNGELISFDSTHEGKRKSYIMDISKIIM